MRRIGIVLAILIVSMGCASTRGSIHGVYRDANMDFGQIQNVAVMPFANLSRESNAAERVRGVFMTMLLASQSIYVVPPGEVSRGISRAGIQTPTAPAADDVIKFASIVKSDAVITGTVQEYGDVRSGTALATVISLQLEMIETHTGKVVWAASSTRGGVTMTDRLFGGGGEPMNVVTEKAVEDLLDKLFGN